MVKDVTFEDEDEGDIGITHRFVRLTNGENGIMVDKVDEGSLAASQGIVSGEYIIKINGRYVYEGSDISEILKVRPLSLQVGSDAEAVAESAAAAERTAGNAALLDAAKRGTTFAQEWSARTARREHSVRTKAMVAGFKQGKNFDEARAMGARAVKELRKEMDLAVAEGGGKKRKSKKRKSKKIKSKKRKQRKTKKRKQRKSKRKQGKTKKRSH